MKIPPSKRVHAAIIRLRKAGHKVYRVPAYDDLHLVDGRARTARWVLNAAATLVVLIVLTSCAGSLVSQSQSDQITQVLTRLGNTLVSDLKAQAAVALAATPPDTDGAQCAGKLPDPAVAGDTGSGALAVAAAIQRVAAVTAGKSVGALTVAEIATLYQPGSAQFNWAIKTLETGCIAKVHDVNQAINSTAGIITALPSVLSLAALPVGA